MSLTQAQLDAESAEFKDQLRELFTTYGWRESKPYTDSYTYSAGFCLRTHPLRYSGKPNFPKDGPPHCPDVDSWQVKVWVQGYDSREEETAHLAALYGLTKGQDWVVDTNIDKFGPDLYLGNLVRQDPKGLTITVDASRPKPNMGLYLVPSGIRDMAMTEDDTERYGQALTKWFDKQRRTAYPELAKVKADKTD